MVAPTLPCHMRTARPLRGRGGMAFVSWTIFPVVGVLALAGLRHPRRERSWFAFQLVTALIVGVLCLRAASAGGVYTVLPWQMGAVGTALMLVYWIQHELRRPTNFEMALVLALLLIETMFVIGLVNGELARRGLEAPESPTDLSKP